MKSLKLKNIGPITEANVGGLILLVSFFLIAVSSSMLFAGDINVVKIGQWGSGLYYDAVIKDHYAYIAAGGSGIDIIDIGSPSTPAVIGNEILGAAAIAVDVRGNYAYVACNNGLHIVDVSIPAAPESVGFYSISDYHDAFHGIPPRATGIIANGNYAYLAIIYGKYSSCQILQLDVSEPTRPRSTGSKIFAGDESAIYSEFPMQISGNYLFYTDNLEGSLGIVDISNPSSLQLINAIYRVNHFAVSGQYVYVTDYKNLTIFNIQDPAAPLQMGSRAINHPVVEIFAAANHVYLVYKLSQSQWQMEVLDVSNPSAPRSLGTCLLSASPAELTVAGATALVTARESGLFSFNVVGPASPTLLTHYDSSWQPLDLSVNGARAYVADSGGELRIFDISTPTTPIEMGNYTSSTYLKAIALKGNYAYLATYENGLEIIDVKNPHQPRYVGNYYVHPGDDCNVLDVVVSGNYAYMTEYVGKFYVLDLSDPAFPRQVGYFSHGSSYKNYIHIHGDYAFWSGENEIDVIDISNPASPTLITRLYDSYIRTGAVYLQDRYVYVANNEGSPNSLDIFDFSVPTAAGRIGEFYINSSISDIYVKGNYAYLATYTGLDVVDVSDPKTMTFAGHFDAMAADGAVLVSGDYIYLAAKESGKFSILKFLPGPTPAQLRVNRSALRFYADQEKNLTGPQSFFIDTPGDNKLEWSLSTLSWTLMSEVDWIRCSQTGGIGSAEVEVSIDPAVVDRILQNEWATFDLGVISISAPEALNPGAKIWVSISIYEDNETMVPFGEFSTPIDNTVVSGSIPVTGWALDNIGVEGVQIFREVKGNLIYVGDAVFVDGARPDVEFRYQYYPNSFKAGWGYMLLTNSLPGGDGPLTLHAIAFDREGNRVTLGARTVKVDNTHAVKPFGAIDTPAQGGTASGSEYVNFGWALTPLPNKIPTDGSTIRVWVDGVPLGSPVYNIYREDIAALFPGYRNSSGAVGYFKLDTTRYNNGVHTIAWSVTDDAGNTDGIGSRYFTIRSHSAASSQGTVDNGRPGDFLKIPVDHFTPVNIKKGYDLNAEEQEIYPGKNGISSIKIEELAPLVISLNHDRENDSSLYYTGYLLVGNRLRPLPIGSFLDGSRGVFSWQAGPGFIGEYRFVFIEKGPNGESAKRNVKVIITPKFQRGERRGRCM